MKPHILLLTALLTVHAIAQAQDQQCVTARKQAVSASLNVVNEIDASIGQVPPAEANYLQTEYVGANKDHNQARYNMLTQRPYYAAWALRGSLARVREELDGMGGPTYDDSLERFQVKRAAFVMARLSFAANDWMAYSRVDGASKHPALSDEQRERYSEQLGGLSAILATYIGCTVDGIK